MPRPSSAALTRNRVPVSAKKKPLVPTAMVFFFAGPGVVTARARDRNDFCFATQPSDFWFATQAVARHSSARRPGRARGPPKRGCLCHPFRWIPKITGKMCFLIMCLCFFPLFVFGAMCFFYTQQLPDSSLCGHCASVQSLLVCGHLQSLRERDPRT